MKTVDPGREPTHLVDCCQQRLTPAPESASKWHTRRGAIAVLAALVMTMIMAFAAFSIDLGYILVTKTELHAGADAAAMAAASILVRDPDLSDSVKAGNAVDEAIFMAERNLPDHGAVLSRQDVRVGIWNSTSRRFTASVADANAVEVTVRRADDNGNALPLFFAPVIGHHRSNLAVTSIALTPTPGTEDVLPIALRDAKFGPVDGAISAENPGKSGPSRPADGVAFRKDEEVVLFQFGKGKSSPVHLTLNPGDGTDPKDVLDPDSSPNFVRMGENDLFRVASEGTGGGGYGSALADRIDLPMSSSQRRTVVPVVSETSTSRNSSGALTGSVRVSGFVEVLLDRVERRKVPDPSSPGKTIQIEVLVARVLSKQYVPGDAEHPVTQSRLVK